MRYALVCTIVTLIGCAVSVPAPHGSATCDDVRDLVEAHAYGRPNLHCCADVSGECYASIVAANNVTEQDAALEACGIVDHGQGPSCDDRHGSL